MNRRSFLQVTTGSTLSLLLLPKHLPAADAAAEVPLFDISLAQWSLNKSLRAGRLTNLDFPKVARREFDIDCVEFVDQFFADKAKDHAYLTELKKRGRDEGVKLGLIMLDTNGPLGAADRAERDKAVDKTKEWMDAAKFLGCHTIRVNARGPGNGDELRGRIAESCARLADHDPELNITIENHGGLSSDPDWLISVMRAVSKPNFGTLPDFGNFPDDVDRYLAVERLLPFAKAVSAKSMRFSDDGRITDTDYPRMMRLVRDAGYHGHVGVESSARNADEEARAIRITRDSLRRIREDQSKCRPIFNGRNLEGWTIREGGDWTVENGAIVGRNGGGWSHNAEKSGTWLSTEKQYADFRLEFQYTINEGGNSGVFFRSSHERNPAFNGYEFQLHNAPGQPPSKHGPAAIYDLAAPTKNLVRPTGQWNTVTLVAQGSRITAEMNGEKVLETELDRFEKGYIGLQIHDEKSEVKFKNIRVRPLS